MDPTLTSPDLNKSRKYSLNYKFIESLPLVFTDHAFIFYLFQSAYRYFYLCVAMIFFPDHTPFIFAIHSIYMSNVLNYLVFLQGSIKQNFPLAAVGVLPRFSCVHLLLMFTFTKT